MYYGLQQSPDLHMRNFALLSNVVNRTIRAMKLVEMSAAKEHKEPRAGVSQQPNLV